LNFTTHLFSPSFLISAFHTKKKAVPIVLAAFSEVIFQGNLYKKYQRQALLLCCSTALVHQQSRQLLTLEGGSADVVYSIHRDDEGQRQKKGAI
jgi:hypothetical protein